MPLGTPVKTGIPLRMDATFFTHLDTRIVR